MRLLQQDSLQMEANSSCTVSFFIETREMVEDQEQTFMRVIMAFIREARHD